MFNGLLDFILEVALLIGPSNEDSDEKKEEEEEKINDNEFYKDEFYEDEFIFDEDENECQDVNKQMQTRKS